MYDPASTAPFSCPVHVATNRPGLTLFSVAVLVPQGIRRRIMVVVDGGRRDLGMLRRIIVLSAFAAGLSSFGAQAAVLPEGEDLRPAAHQAAEGIQLAQYGDVEIYYDEFGRRVVVDAYTGEVISVERPRRMERQLRRDARRERREVMRGDD